MHGAGSSCSVPARDRSRPPLHLSRLETGRHRAVDPLGALQNAACFLHLRRAQHLRNMQQHEALRYLAAAADAPESNTQKSNMTLSTADRAAPSAA